VDIELASGGRLRVEALAKHTFRVRLSSGEGSVEPGLTRYGILHTDWPDVDCQVEQSDREISIRTSEASLGVNVSDGQLTFRDASGDVLLGSAGAPVCDPAGGFEAQFKLSDGERLFGLGDETRDRIQKRGHKTMMWVTNCTCYAPTPYLMSSHGWAMFVNTTWRHFFDLGHGDPDVMRFWAQGGDLDFYLIAGGQFGTLLDRFTDLVGKPALLPLSGYGFTFVQNEDIDAHGMLQDGLNFRNMGFPCDQMELEPSWMSQRYDYSTDKDWNPEKWVVPYWCAGLKGPGTFIGAAEQLGFKLCLWLCMDYDLSLHEEYLLTGRWEPPLVEKHREYEKEFNGIFDDENMSAIKARQDKITKPQERWFEHLKRFVDEGVTGFKMDASLGVAEHADRKWGNGMDDEEMHNLYQVLYAKEMCTGFREHTGRRPMLWSSCGYAGTSQYVATWAGDTGIGPDELVSMLTHGMCGHSNTCADGLLFTPANAHFTFLMAWAKMHSWMCWTHPAYLHKRMKPIATYYARLRYRLLPYIYSMAHVANRTGMPIMRAMPLVYQDDPAWDNRLRQYMLGEWFLVSAYTEEVFLPDGLWIDYWTGESHHGPKRVVGGIPADRGGHLFVRGGAIIPYWPQMNYVGEEPVDVLDLHIYADGDSSFTLYEDDGVTYAYENGGIATTEITCRANDGEIAVEIGPRVGEYDSMPATRSFRVRVFSDKLPDAVAVNGHPLPEGGDNGGGWHYRGDERAVQFEAQESPDRKTPVSIRIVLGSIKG